MITSARFKNRKFILGYIALMLTFDAHAHLMSAQNGILNISGTYAYLAVSVPISSLQFNDQDNDGLLSNQELGDQSSSISSQLSEGVELKNKEQNLSKEVAMISINGEEGDHLNSSSQLLAMYKFALPPDTSCAEMESFKEIGLFLTLYGNKKSEESISITILLCGEKNKIITDQSHPYAGIYRD